MGGIILNFLAQSCHVRIDGAMGDVHILAPQCVEEIIPANDFAPAAEQQRQELKLLESQLDLFFSFKHRLLSEI